MSAETISVVVCTHTEERWSDLSACLESLRRQVIAPGQIVVVVDHNPALLTRVRAHWDDVLAIENENAACLSGARNTGLAAARHRVVAFLDDDATAAPDWVERLVETYADPAVLAVGGAIEPSWPGGTPPAWFPNEFDWVVGCTYRGMPKEMTEVRNLIGANMSFRREILASVEGFRESLGRVGMYPAGCEETEFCVRLHDRWPDGKILHNPAARVTHRVSPDRATFRYFLARCIGEGSSKAVLRRLVGARRALESERRYTLRTLPRGVARGFADALVHGDGGGILRAAAIIVGLGATTAAYAAGHLSSTHQGSRVDRLARDALR